MVVVIFGPMGCGKTTVGRLLAQQAGFFFDDADDFHPPGNVKKMSAGIPLNDNDRIGWLTLLANRIRERLTRGQNLVLACSALKQSYRDILGINQQDVISVYLKGSQALLEERLKMRTHQYMHDSLLASQLETLEEPSNGLIVEISKSPAEIVEKVIRFIDAKEGNI